MKSSVLLCCGVVSALILTAAEVPSPPNLLPDDTMVVITVPSMAKARTAYAQSPQIQLWNDPAMKPFREKFTTKLKTDVLEPLEKELNIKFADYEELAQGQLTLALVRNGWTGGTNPEPALIVLLDSGSKAEQLTKNLTDLRKKWSESGKQTRVEKIRDIEFSVLSLSADDLSAPFKNVFGGSDSDKEDNETDTDEPPKPAKKEDLFIGQSGSVLILGDNLKVIEKVLAKLAGGQVPALAEQSGFETANRKLFREAVAYGWVDAKGFIDALIAQAKEEEDPDGPTFFPSVDKILPVLGLKALRTAAFSLQVEVSGSTVEFFIGVPASERAGLLKIVAVEAKEAGPPPFVPAEVTKYQRVRLDLAKAWAELESMIAKIAPGGINPLEIAMANVGKDKDPNFDFKKTLLAGLGDDIVTYQKPPKGTSLLELNSPPSLTLFGSPDPEKLVLALKAVVTMLPPPYSSSSEVKEREFLGRKIYTLAPPQVEGVEIPGGGTHFASSGNYLAIARDPAMVEEFIRSGESPGKSLRERSGLLDAAQKVGGTGTGWFGFTDESQQMKLTLEVMRKSDGDADEPAGISLNPFNPLSGQFQMKDWFDLSLLPEFSQIAKYFYMTLHSGSATDDGLSFKYYSPTSPELRK
jgi:hypothetical protein